MFCFPLSRRNMTAATVQALAPISSAVGKAKLMGGKTQTVNWTIAN